MERAQRLALGQWFTPAPVADLALALALPVGPERRRCRVLDPACGDGAFLVRAVHAGVSPTRVTGIDVDPAAASACAARLGDADIRLADVFAMPAADAGWDAVVGNPPYVRQERQSPTQKQRVRARLAADWPSLAPADLDAITARGDLAAAFVLRSLRLVRPGGRVALVVSGAMLDAGYAARLWRCVAAVGRVVAIVDAPEERWFQDAAVNTIIIVLERARVGEARAPVAEVTIARLRGATAAAAARVGCVEDLAAVAEVRHANASRSQRWSVLMRAPRAWLEFERAAADALVPLGDLASIRRGVTSGANDVFYLTREEAAGSGIEAAVLRPLVRSPRARGAHRIAIDPDATSHVALMCPPGDDTLAGLPGARRYLARREAAAARPTLRARPYWWSLPARPARLFLAKAYAARFVQRLSPVPVVADQRVYAVTPKPGVHVEALAAVLNSTYTSLALEACGRASLGEGALEWTVADARTLLVVDPRRADADGTRALVAALRTLATRAVLDVERELGRADRQALDREVARLVPDSCPRVETLGDALIASVTRRAGRSRRGIAP